MNVAFDVDGTLIGVDGKQRNDVVMLLLSLANKFNHVYVWSGGGIDYAKARVRELDLVEEVYGYLPKQKTEWMDFCFDDQEVKLAKFNFVV